MLLSGDATGQGLAARLVQLHLMCGWMLGWMVEATGVALDLLTVRQPTFDARFQTHRGSLLASKVGT